MRSPALPQARTFGTEIDPLLLPLELTDDEQRAIVEFLRFGLTDPRVMNELPPFDRPRLGSEP